jgi:hypothetical protein
MSGGLMALPAVYPRRTLRMGCVSTALDPALHRSALKVIWFQDDLAAPIPEPTATCLKS